jgi:hypothetical protein
MSHCFKLRPISLVVKLTIPSKAYFYAVNEDFVGAENNNGKAKQNSGSAETGIFD